MQKGKTVLITGGVSGIGSATARLMHANGARVAIAGRFAALSRLKRCVSLV